MGEGQGLAWVAGALADLDDRGLRRVVRNRDRPGRHHGLIDVSNNDYLGLAHDRSLRAAASAATAWGAGAGASRLVVGGSTVHQQLEQAIADWKGTDDALVFSSGYMANVGVIPALVGPGDLIVSDALNHASIIDGCRLSGATVLVHRHGDVEHARSLVSGRGTGRVLIVTDGVFSMDGDAADLVGLAELARDVGAMLMVDDAHGGGVIGPDGRGTAAAQGVAEQVDVHMGTLSKAVGAAGGFVAGSAGLVEWLRSRARTFVFDTAPPPAVAAAALEGVRIARTDHSRREAAVARATQLAERLGVPTPAACVVPWIVGDVAPAMALAGRLEEAGFLAVAIRPPTVPVGTARIRLAMRADIPPDTVDHLADVLLTP